MSDEEEDAKLALVTNPEIVKLCKALRNLPQILEEKRRKARERSAFNWAVCGEALKQAGLLDRKFYQPHEDLKVVLAAREAELKEREERRKRKEQ